MHPRISIDLIEQLAEPKIMERGKNYYEDGLIIGAVIRENKLEAFCHGSQIYRVTATIAENKISMTDCTCPYDWGGICKHRVALLLTYLHEPGKFIERPTIAKLLAKKSKDDLIDLIEQMLAQHTTLIELVDSDLDLPEELFWYDDY